MGRDRKGWREEQKQGSSIALQIINRDAQFVTANTPHASSNARTILSASS